VSLSRRSLELAIIGAGTSYNSDDGRIEMHTDFPGQISTIFLKSLAQDDILPNGITAKSYT